MRVNTSALAARCELTSRRRSKNAGLADRQAGSRSTWLPWGGRPDYRQLQAWPTSRDDPARPTTRPSRRQSSLSMHKPRLWRMRKRAEVDLRNSALKQRLPSPYSAIRAVLATHEQQPLQPERAGQGSPGSGTSGASEGRSRDGQTKPGTIMTGRRRCSSHAQPQACQLDQTRPSRE